MRLNLISWRARLVRLPFWLLAAAWFCANTPQTLMYDAVVWAGNARHFSHQQALSAEVAFLLAGTHAPKLIAAIKDAPAKPFAPSVAEDATVKKIPLAVALDSEGQVDNPRLLFSLQWEWMMADFISTERLDEPPRVTLTT